MEILFLGTSAGWPLPRLGCHCHICSSTDPKDKRLRPSILINKSYLIDASPDIYHQLNLYQIDPSSISHIFITHGHDDHFIGLYDLSHLYEKKEKIKLVTTAGVLAQIRKRVAVSIQAFKVEEAKPFKEFELGNNNAGWFIPVKHGAVEAYGIKIKAAKPIFYAPEFRKILPSSKKLLGDLELAIIDGSSKTSYGQAKGHETIEEGLRLGKEIRAKRVLFTNIGHKTDKHESLQSFVKTKGGDKFSIAFDGQKIKL